VKIKSNQFPTHYRAELPDKDYSTETTAFWKTELTVIRRIQAGPSVFERGMQNMYSERRWLGMITAKIPLPAIAFFVCLFVSPHLRALGDEFRQSSSVP
jgi:hypothetical protein